MSNTEMTLMMRIVANGDAAKRVLKDVDQHIRGLSSGVSTFTATAGKTFGFLGGALGTFLSPLKYAAEGALALAGATAAFGTAAVYAAADDEKLINRLAALYGSTLKAKGVFEGLEAIARKNPFPVESLVEATFTLEQFGMAGEKNLLTLANAAKAAGMDLETLVLSVGALQERGLKRFGINLDTKNDSTVITFRDRMGQVHKLVAATADDARRQLMEVLSIKFSGGVAGSTGQGLTGLIQTLKNSIGQAMANIGDGMLPAVKRMVTWITDALNKWIESGKLLELGKKMGEWLSSAVDHIMAFFDTLPKFFEAVTKLWNQGGENLGRVLNVALSAGGTIIATAFVAALQASYDIWAGIAQMLGAAVEEAIMSMPGMPGTRAGRAETAINAMPMDQLMATAKQAKLFGAHTDEVLATIGQATPETARFAIAKQVAKLGEKVQKQFIFAQAGNDFKAGAGRAAGAIPNMVSLISTTAKDELGKVLSTLSTATGMPDLRDEYNKSLAIRQAEQAALRDEYNKSLAIRQAEQAAAPSGFARYSLEKREFVPTATGGHSRMVPSGSFVGEAGAYQQGQRVNGQTIVNIENLTVKANDTVQLQKELLKAGVYGGHAAAAAAAF